MAQYSLLVSMYHALRSVLGPSGVCLYPITCSTYARITFKNKPLWLSVPMITLRLLSCNPITGLIRFILFKRAQHKHVQSYPCSRVEQPRH